MLGTHAEYVALKEESIALVPDNISLVDAASVPLVALTAWQAFYSTDPKPSQRILIFSASSGVGLSAVQFAKNLGHYVVGTAGAKNLELVRSFGADEASSARRPYFASAAQLQTDAYRLGSRNSSFDALRAVMSLCCGGWIQALRTIHELMHCGCAGGVAEQVFDYAEGDEPLRAKFGGSDETKFDVLIDIVRADRGSHGFLLISKCADSAECQQRMRAL